MCSWADVLKLVAALAVVMMACLPAFAAGGPECVNVPPFPTCTQISAWVDLSPGFGSSSTLTASVDTSNGNVRTSFQVGGSFPYGKALVFYHNSQDNRAYPAGVGTNHTHSPTLLEHSDEWHPVAVRIVLPDGYRIGFDENLDGTYRGEPGVFSRLYRETDGSYRLYTTDSPSMVDDGDVCYRFGTPDGEGRSRLETVTSASGTITLSYVASGPGAGEVDRVREDSTGREAEFAYDDAGRLQSVSSLDGVTTTFSYNPSGDISSVTSSWGALTFGYDSYHNVSTITDGAGGHVAYITYAESARGVQFRDTQAQIYDFGYSTDGADKVVSTTFGLRGATPTTHEIAPNRLVAAVDAPGKPRIWYTYTADKCLAEQGY